MKKITDRQFVSLAPERRKGRVTHVVTWMPSPGIRRRRRFSDLEKATTEANRLEKFLRAGQSAATEIPKAMLARIIMLVREYPDPEIACGVLETGLKKHSDSWKDAEITIEKVGQEFITLKTKANGLDIRTQQSYRQHMNRFITRFGNMQLAELTEPRLIEGYLDSIGNMPKTRSQHLITIVAFFNWLRDKRCLLPHDRKTVAERVERIIVPKRAKQAFTIEEMMCLLAASPRELISWYAIGAFGGIREEERGQLLWKNWVNEEGEDNRIVCETGVTKTKTPRSVPVPANLNAWLLLVKGEPDDRMEGWADPLVRSRAHRGGVTWKQNGLRVSFASYHLCLHDNAALTSEIAGHSIKELRETYKTITGVNKTTARAWFNITPASVLAFAKERKIPTPSWAEKAC